MCPAHYCWGKKQCVQSMSSVVHAFEREVMFLSQSLLWNIIRALKAERCFLVVQVLYVAWAYLKTPSSNHQKFNQSLILNCLSTLPLMTHSRLQWMRCKVQMPSVFCIQSSYESHCKHAHEKICQDLVQNCVLKICFATLYKYSGIVRMPVVF